MYLRTGIVLSTLILAVFWLAGCGDDDSDSGPIPPGQVANFQAEPRNESVKLTWNASIELDLKEYRITYSPGGATPVVIPEGDTEYIVSDLTNETAYTFTIVAVNDTDQESEPAEATATPSMNAAIIPGTFALNFTGITAEYEVWGDSSLIALAPDGSNEVALAWSAAENVVSYTILGKYVLDTTLTMLADWEVIKEDITGTNTTINHDDVDMPGIIYQYAVRAISEDNSPRDSDDTGYLLTRGRPGTSITIDGSTYETVQVGNLVWTARNLAADADPIQGRDLDFNHPKYTIGNANSMENSGRLYAYEAAKQVADGVSDFDLPVELDFILLAAQLGWDMEGNLNNKNAQLAGNTIFPAATKSATGWWDDHDQIEVNADECDGCTGEGYLGLDFFPGGIAETVWWEDGCCYFGWPMYLHSSIEGDGSFRAIIIWGWNGQSAFEGGTDLRYGFARDPGNALGDTSADAIAAGEYGRGAYMGSVRLIRRL